MTERSDIYERITNQIITAIELGAGNWTGPWQNTTGIPANANTGKRYRGINIISLWAEALAQGFASNLWATYGQWQELNAQVKKGEKAAHVVFWKFFDSDQQDGVEPVNQEADLQHRRAPMARFYSVFNADQEGFTLPLAPPMLIEQRNDEAEKFFASTGAEIRHGGDHAYYCPCTDHIQVPPYHAFHSVEKYLGTLSHEAAHWTGATHRLNRDLKHRFGTETYCAEEIIAELCACFICADLGVEMQVTADHAAYIQTWITKWQARHFSSNH